MQQRPVLAVTQGPDKGQVISVDLDSVRIGRDPACQILLTDAQISRKHVKIYKTEASWNIVDLNSSNGTLVNGEQITLKELEDGDVFIIGESMIGFHLSGDAHHPNDLTAKYSDTQTIVIDERSLYTHWESRDTIDELKRARTDLEALYRAGRTINGILRTSELVPMLLDVIFREMPRVDRVSVYLRDDAGALACAAGKVRGRDLKESETIFSQTLAEAVLRDGTAQLTYDASQDHRFVEVESIQQQGIRAAICVPLQANEQMFGILYADSTNPENRFRVDDLRFMAAIGLQAGTALENARLYERLEQEKAALDDAHEALKSTQDQLVQSEKLAAVGQLASGIVHEMKNPMTVILGYAGLIRDKVKDVTANLDDDRGIGHLADEVEDGVGQVNQVIEQLLLFARPSEPKVTFVSTSKVVEDTLRFLKHETNAAGIKVKNQVPEVLPDVNIDDNQVKQVFINIVLNAVQAMERRKGLLVVTGKTVRREDRQFVQLEFSDNGCGMSPEQCSRIFEPFFSTKAPGSGVGGTGLGLSVSYAIIEKHGGSISVTSLPGEGSKFIVTLPTS
jgi:signal transduction histidine kinase/pSer/pThr/pTyr-binding forkhead associated (FHA) protein